MLIRAALFLLILGLLYSVSIAQGTDVDRIIAGSVSAVGPIREIEKFRNLSASAACFGPKGEYTTSLVSFRTDKTRFEQTFTYKPDKTNVSINGDLVWISEKGEPVISTPFQRMVVRAHEYQKMAFNIRKFFTGFEMMGDENFEGRPSVRIKAKNELGMTTHLYFDKETKRFSGYALEIPNSTEKIKNVILEWKKVGNLTLPSVVRATDNQGDWTLRFHTIKLNSGDEKLLDVPPRIADMAELLRLHEQQKTAHLTYNAELFIEMFAENLTQIQRGNSVTRTKGENLARFKQYFSGFKFQEWEDMAPPVIKISKDGTLATISVKKSVKGTYKNEKGEDEADHTIFAWLEVWEKIDGKWKVSTVASTERSGPKTK